MLGGGGGDIRVGRDRNSRRIGGNADKCKRERVRQRERKRTQWARALRAPVAGGGNRPPVALGGGDRVGDAELRLMQYKTARWKRRDGHSAEGRFAIEVVFVLV